VTRSGSLWEPRDPDAPNPLAGIVVRPPTAEEADRLREALRRAEEESPFREPERRT
jgi:hypothetical protein